MNSGRPRKLPTAPPVYPVQVLPRSLQPKSETSGPQATLNRLSPQRILRVPGPAQFAVAQLRPQIIQRAAASTPARRPRGAAGGGGGGGGGAPVAAGGRHTPAGQWMLFCRYRLGQAKEVQSAFIKAGCTEATLKATIMTAIRVLNLPKLPAHGSGAAGDGEQGDLEEKVTVWHTKLMAAASALNVVVATRRSRGLEHNREEKKAVRVKKVGEKKEKAQGKKEKALAACISSGKHYAGGSSGTCKNCGGS
jgi:hypothetical protein